MASKIAARLERLRVLVQDDLAALPDRPAPPALSDRDDEEAAGGVPLESNQDAQLHSGKPSSPEAGVEQAASSTAEAAAATTEPTMEPRPTTNGESLQENNERGFVSVHGTESSHDLASKPELSPLPATKPSSNRLQRSQLAPPDEKYFTPINALAKYPYKHCNKDCMQDIASAFFDQGKFWAREWDLFYLWGIEEDKPLILVTETQFEALLKEINSHLQLGLKITQLEREDGLVSRFPDHPRCRPRYLGRSRSRDEYDTMTKRVPDPTVHAPDELAPPSLDDVTKEDFKERFAAACDAQKKDNRKSKAAKREDRVNKLLVMADAFKRAQRYLGLRPSATDGQPVPGLPPAVDVSLPAPYANDRSPVFVCVDVESDERNHHIVTEIGVAILDTLDLIGVAPGNDGEDWRPKIRARHFRIEEYKHKVNSLYVSGCPDRFYFGTSEFVSRDNAHAVVAACFHPPYCAGAGQASGLEERNLIILGHDTLTDIKYLQSMGFNPLDLPKLLEAQDSSTLYRVWRRDQQPTSLGKILADFDIPGWGLHNAGNDAVYTVQAFLCVCVREASIRGSSRMQELRREQAEMQASLAHQKRKEEIEDEAKAWENMEAEGDGGAPVPIHIKEKAAPRHVPNDTETDNNEGSGGLPQKDTHGALVSTGVGPPARSARIAQEEPNGVPLPITDGGLPVSFEGERDDDSMFPNGNGRGRGWKGRGHGRRGQGNVPPAPKGRGRATSGYNQSDFYNHFERDSAQFRCSGRGATKHDRGLHNHRFQSVAPSTFGRGRERSRGRGRGRAQVSPVPETYLHWNGSLTVRDAPAEPEIEGSDDWSDLKAACPPEPASLPFAGRIGGNQEFFVSSADSDFSSIVAKTSDATPFFTWTESDNLVTFSTFNLWKEATIEGVTIISTGLGL